MKYIKLIALSMLFGFQTFLMATQTQNEDLSPMRVQGDSQKTDLLGDFFPDEIRIKSKLFTNHWEDIEWFMEILKNHKSTQEHYPEFEPRLKKGLQTAQSHAQNDDNLTLLASIEKELESCMSDETLTLPRTLFLATKTGLAMSLAREVLESKECPLHLEIFHLYWDYETMKTKVKLYGGEEVLAPYLNQRDRPHLPIISVNPKFGIQTWNWAFLNHCFLVSVPLKDDYVHGKVYTPDRFIAHELSHNDTLLRVAARGSDSLNILIDVFRKIYLKIQIEEDEINYKKGQIAFFIAAHELINLEYKKIGNGTDAELFRIIMNDYVWNAFDISFPIKKQDKADWKKRMPRSLEPSFPDKKIEYVGDDETGYFTVEGQDHRWDFFEDPRTENDLLLGWLRFHMPLIPLLEMCNEEKYDQAHKKLAKGIVGNGGSPFESLDASTKVQLVSFYKQIRSDVKDLLEWFQARYGM